ncbi:hypothetical protein GH714_012825 [Hevea brasiliensis]|uniref:Uncharacterized protein n=1 Tax=Hevea brasiliensis TaxID=3981 RepID=A0A6A6KFG3_HEVBR|nr:hypothetical protein GH714_012825 [Hevea brasiliensis]
MGSLIGHVLPGTAFLALGLWHLFNHIKLYSLHPNSYTSSPWFPTPKLRFKPKAQLGLTQLLGAVAFGQQFFLFHLHSTDHKGLEGQYHLLLQAIIIVSLVTTLTGIGLPRSFLVSFVRSVSIVFQGVWLIVMGYMLWTPKLIPKGCALYDEDDHHVVRCGSQESLHRAKSLVNIQFSWLLIGIAIFAISFYLGLVERFGKRVEHYSALPKEFEEMKEEEEEEVFSDVESQKEKKFGESRGSFIHMGAGLAPFNMER